MNLFSGKLKDFSAIYSDFYPVIYNGIYAQVRDIDISSDLAQEVFTRLLESIDKVDNSRAWLLGAMKMVLFEYYRKMRPDVLNIDDFFDDVNMRYVNGFRDTRIIIHDESFETGINKGR